MGVTTPMHIGDITASSMHENITFDHITVDLDYIFHIYKKVVHHDESWSLIQPRANRKNRSSRTLRTNFIASAGASRAYWRSV